MMVRACAVWVLVLGLPCGLVRAADPVSDLPREVEIHGVEFVRVPSGWLHYSVGTEAQEHGNVLPWYREARVWIDGFYIGKYEARARDLLPYLRSGAARSDIPDLRGDTTKHDEMEHPEGVGCTVRPDGAGGWLLVEHAEGELPATALSWRLADAWARWMGFRLPSEAEWQRAARGDDRRLWPWGNEYPDDTYGQLERMSVECAPAPVGRHPLNLSPFGAYDMAGNVSEYVADWFNRGFDDGLRDGMRNPPLAVSATRRFDGLRHLEEKILLGGGWGAAGLRSAIPHRIYARPQAAGTYHGVRFALDAGRVREYLATSGTTGGRGGSKVERDAR